MKISNKIQISKKSKPLLVAEVSANHSGNKSRFLKHIIEAKNSGADLVKIQTYEENKICCDPINLKKSSNMFNETKKLYNLYKKSKTPFKWHKDAFNLAKKNKIELFSTPFSIDSVDFLEKFNPKIYKISSFEITDYQLVSKIASLKKPIIISSGMATLSEVKRCVGWINKFHNRIIILYCVSGYPTPENQLNLNSIKIFKENFKKNLIGLSDHTNDIFSSLAASTIPVSLIEKHFIIDNKKTFDSKFSINPAQLNQLSVGLKKISKAFGVDKIFLKRSEKKNIKFRRSIFAKKFIEKGQLIKEEDLITFRPKIGICASKFNQVVGNKSKKNILKLKPIYKKDLLKSLK